MKTKKRGPPITHVPKKHHDSNNLWLSQNFLRDPNLVDRLIQQAGIGKADTVIDIGAGEGALTRALAKHCAKVIAVEKDHMLCNALRNTFNKVRNVEVVCDDFLEWPLPEYAYKVFANIPYIATAAIVTKLTSASNPPLDAHLTMQFEASQKFSGMPKESLSALLLKPSFRVNITHHYKRTDFVPTPHVDSAMLRIQQRQRPILTQSAYALYQDFVVYCFTNAGVSLYDTLVKLMGQPALQTITSMFGISPAATPTVLDFEMWLALFSQFAQHAPAHARRWVMGSAQRIKHEQTQLQKLHRTRRPRDVEMCITLISAIVS